MGKNTQQKSLTTIKPQSNITREFSSGGVVFKREGANIYWVVAASSPSIEFPKIVWRLPKGWIDDAGVGVPGPMASGKKKTDEESLQKTAVREVGEETGVEAKILQKIGTEIYSYVHPSRGKVLKLVTFYLMEWKRDLSEGFDGETSEIAWLPYGDAYKKLSFSGEKQMLKKAKTLLENPHS